MKNWNKPNTIIDKNKIDSDVVISYDALKYETHFISTYKQRIISRVNSLLWYIDDYNFVNMRFSILAF